MSFDVYYGLMSSTVTNYLRYMIWLVKPRGSLEFNYGSDIVNLYVM